MIQINVLERTAVLLFLSCGISTCFKPPHIIFMLIDDLGWNDVSFHGSLEIPTPNIDTLAYTGVILNNYYVQPLCTPSRGSLMTGKYPIKLGLQHYVIAAGEPWGLPLKEKILPQRLKELGYATHAVGKWHLGYFKSKYVPTSRGFDSFFGYYEGKGNYFTHYDYEDKFCGLDLHECNRPAWNYSGFYSTELFTKKATDIIYDHDTSQPLFLYFSHQAVHGGNSADPLQAPSEYIKRFPHIKDEQRRKFAAIVSALDDSVAKIFYALLEKNMLENSIIVFSTDNGGAVRGIDGSSGSNWPLRGSKYNLWEGGVRGTAFIWSPLLPSSKEKVSNNLMHISDWLPTLYAAAGGNTKNLGKIDGYNFWPSLKGDLPSSRKHILLNIDEVWKVESVRKNQYKLLKGSALSGKFDGWFDKEGKKEESKPFNCEEFNKLLSIYRKTLLQSVLFRYFDFHCGNVYENETIYIEGESCPSDRWIHKDFLHFIECNKEWYKKDYHMHPFSEPLIIDCGVKPVNASENCLPEKEYCLFDIEKDPCEYFNLIDKLPSVTQDLKKLLDEYRRSAVKIRNKKRDPMANPKYHGYAWQPWRDHK